MTIYPAVDIREGKCVRLLRGAFDETTVYGGDPLAMAEKWAAQGARFLHLVDLDGARYGKSENRAIILEIARKLKIPVQTGGGVRTLADAEELLSGGAARVILGTAAVKNPELVALAAKEYGARIAVGVDAKNGEAAVEGWEETSGLDAVSFARRAAEKGVETIIYTDISTDGTLAGPNVAAARRMAESLAGRARVIASGGVGTTADIAALRPAGVEGVIVGKALYAERFTLAEAIAEGDAPC
jgi:phosphoribosylformimino-5-aminoimidazole carboxamide ribotide isomerase